MAASEAQRPDRGYVSAWLEPGLRSQIEELAARNDRSVSAELRVALRQHVAEQQRGRTGASGSSPSDQAAAGAQ
jgi:hypothetical protein